MGVQKTFTIIPPAGPATRTPIDNRPMTSKQVRKAYQAANRVPRLSKAERIKQERAEQERIRKEFEKEKAAAKAKLLREKKKAKENAEREEKKKKGLPLVTVRPSQDTIAKFFRGNGLGHKRSCEGEDVGETTDTTKAPALPTVEELAEEEDDDEDDFPSPKRLCNEREKNEQDGEGEEEVGEETSPVPEEPCAEPCVIVEEKQKEFIIDDDFLDGLEILSDEEMSKLSFNETVTAIGVDNAKQDIAPQSPVELGDMPVEEEKSHLHDKTTHHPSNPITSTKNPEPIALQEFDLIFDDEEDLELEMLALDAVVTSPLQSLKKSIEKPLPLSSQKPIRKTTGYEIDLGLAAGSSPDKEAQQAKSQREHDQSLMPPPPIRSTPRPSITSNSPVAAKAQAPPPSTQQILFNMDDFFPTSSQQAVELEEEEITFISPIKSGLMSKTRAPNAPQVSPKDLLPSGTLSSSPEPPKPFFTASGSNERIAVALLRSRRTAEQEEERRRQAVRLELAEIERAKKKEVERRAREERLADGKLKANNASHAAVRTIRDERQSLNPASPASPAITRAPQFSARKRLIMNDYRTPSKPTLQRTPLVETNPKAVVPHTESPIVANMGRKVTSLSGTIRPSPSPFTSRNTNRTLVQEAKHQYSSPKHTKTPIKSANKPNDIIASPENSESKCPPASQESEFGGSWMDELATELSL